MWAYQRPEGHAALRGYVARRLEARGAPVRAEKILLTTGCTQALHLALQIHTRPGEIVACESPCYYNLLEQIHQAGCRALPLPVGETGFDMARTEAALRRHRPSCLVVCPTLSNPSTATLPEAARGALVRLCRKLKVRLIEDDIYSELHEAGAPKPLLAWDRNGSVVTYVTSFCKSVAPGLRVGVMIAGDGFERAVRLKCMSDLHSAVVAEATLAAFMEGGELEGHLSRLREDCRKRRTILREAVAKYFPEGTRIPQAPGGFILWVELPTLVDRVRLRNEARRRKVSFAPGEIFFTHPPRRTCMRLNAARAGVGDLQRGARLLGQALASLG